MHINSSIPNRAFHLAALAIGGYSWERLGRIWYATVRDNRLTTEPSFEKFARLTTDVAGQLYGASSAEQQAVVDAWARVGVVKVA